MYASTNKLSNCFVEHTPHSLYGQASTTSQNVDGTTFFSIQVPTLDITSDSLTFPSREVGLLVIS